MNRIATESKVRKILDTTFMYPFDIEDYAIK